MNNTEYQKIYDKTKNYSFEKKDLYTFDPRFSLIYYTLDQNKIPEQININFINIIANFDGYQSRFFDFYSSSKCGIIFKINITDSTFQNMASLKNGGCIRAKFCNEQEIDTYALIKIKNTVFKQCKSIFYGGAIFTNGILQLQDVIFRECQSEFGPAIVIYNSTFLKQNNITYIDNKSKMYDNSIFIFWSIFEIDEVFYLDQDQNYRKKEHIDEDGGFSLTPGIFYMIKFKISAESFPKSNREKYIYNTQDDNFLDNIYEHVDLEKTNLSQYLFNFDYMNKYHSFPYLLIKFNFQQIEINKIYFKQNKNYVNLKFKKTECLNGMYKVQVIPMSDIYECKTCLNMTASYDNKGCKKCHSQYFSYCFSNITYVLSGHYRTEYSIDIKKIFQCKFNQNSCLGGEGINNQLCGKGHIGNECKICDLPGQYWNETYGNYGLYQCIPCSHIKYNKTFMVGFIIFFIIVISFLINSNIIRIESLVKQNYLSKMNIMYFGSSFRNQGLSSIYFKIFSFYTLMLYHMKQQVNLNNISKTFLSLSIQLQNPIVGGFVSLDCAISDVFSGQQNIEIIKFLIIILFPFSLFPIIILIQLNIIKKKKINKNLFSYSAVLSIIYLTFIVFYNSILNIVLDALLCHDFENGERQSLLNLNIECKEMQLKLLIITIPISIVYCVGIPFFIFTTLYLNRKQLTRIPIMFQYGFLYREYREKLYFWEMIRFVVRVCQVFVSKLFLFDFVFMNSVNIIILVLYLKFLIQFKPFQRNFFNTLEQIAILINIVNFFSMIIFFRRQELESFNIQDENDSSNFTNEQNSSNTTEKQNSSNSLNQSTELMIILSCILSFGYLIYLFLMTIYSYFEESIQNRNCPQFYVCRIRRRINFVRAAQSMKLFRQIVNRVIYSNQKKNIELQEYRLLKEDMRRNNIEQQEIYEENFNLIQNIDEQQQKPINQLQSGSLIKDNQENENMSIQQQECGINNSSILDQNSEHKNNSVD